MNGSNVLGAVIAGGASVRFGDVKALARVGGHPIAGRAAAALRAVTPHVVMIANDSTVPETLAMAWRPDLLSGAGPAAGIHAALCWAREDRYDGVVAVACDMPFAEPRLLNALLAGRAGHDAVMPASGGRRGVEPLCAWYRTTCIAAIEAALGRGDRRMIGFLDGLDVHVLGVDEVARFGDPARLFLNVNTRADLDRAQRLAAAEAGDA
jgi:molybdopterin-guanine dinucleotide biosynthesis protein A